MRSRMILVAVVLSLSLFAGLRASEPFRPRDRALDRVDIQPRAAADAQDIVSMNIPKFDSARDALVATGSVYAKVSFEITQAELSEIEVQAPEFWDHLRLLGWERENNRAVRMVPARGAVIRRDGEEITIRESRYAFVEGRGLVRDARAEFARDPRVTVQVADVIVPAEQVEVMRSVSMSGDPLRADVIININLRDSTPRMCHIEPRGGGRGIETNATAQPMTDQRCLDYNGPFTNGVNYEYNTWRRFYNFAGSDWTEHITKKGCYATHGSKTCSRLIGHSSSYHKHSFL
jgi:hypothetical protein